MSWHDVYRSELQGAYLPCLCAVLFLLYRWRAGRRLPATPAGRFVDVYAVAVAIEAALDALATGPLVRTLGVQDAPAGTAVMLTFVLLGDFRVYLLLFALAEMADGGRWTGALGRAAAWTLVVPLIAYAAAAAVRAGLDGVHPNAIWPLYESAFAAVALWLRQVWLARRRLDPALRADLRAVLLYVVAYYALWAAADVLIQLAGLDTGWALRIVPNQLYYSLWAPFVWWRFGRIKTGSTGFTGL